MSETTSIKPIETVYNGYRFRSRLEARWAVFFDTLGIRYEYEPEGFVLSDGTKYLPDFWLTDLHVWVEVKGNMTKEDKHKIEQFRDDHANATKGLGDWSDGALWVVGRIPSEEQLANDMYPYYYEWGDLVWSFDWDWPYIPCVCPVCGKPGIEYDGRGARVCAGCCDYDKGYTGTDIRVQMAYDAARQARFEHGETPSK